MYLNEVKELKERYRYSDLSDSAVSIIRQMLRVSGVPMAAFVDDHVHNAIIQRNISLKDTKELKSIVSALADRIDRIWIPISPQEELEKAAVLAYISCELSVYPDTMALPDNK